MGGLAIARGSLCPLSEMGRAMLLILTLLNMAVLEHRSDDVTSQMATRSSDRTDTQRHQHAVTF